MFQCDKKSRQKITYIEDTIMQALTVEELYSLKKNCLLLRKAVLTAQPEKTKFFLRKVQISGHNVGKVGIQAVKNAKNASLRLVRILLHVH